MMQIIITNKIINDNNKNQNNECNNKYSNHEKNKNKKNTNDDKNENQCNDDRKVIMTPMMIMMMTT